MAAVLAGMINIIPRKTFIEQNRKLPEDYQDRVCAWLDDAANANVIRKCLKFLKTPIEYMDKVTLRVPELVKGYVRMRKQGVPVCVYDADKLEKLLLCEDCIGISS